MKHVSSGLFLALCVCGLAGGVSAQEKEAAKTKKVTAGDLTLQVPEGWVQKELKSQFRTAEFEIPAVKDDKVAGELAIFYFGKGGAGGIQANVTRWIGQFEAEGRKVKTYEGKSKQGDYTLVDLSGTYKKPVGPPIQMVSKKLENHRMLGVILMTEAGPYFLKFDAPAATAAASAEAFRASFGGSAKSETEKKEEK